ncbi:MAG: hypothetical protein FJX74_22365, partial [Armatimonadetes bacterium]|nr:hypothetical protein [Armatimonadota bacterium]
MGRRTLHGAPRRPVARGGVPRRRVRLARDERVHRASVDRPDRLPLGLPRRATRGLPLTNGASLGKVSGRDAIRPNDDGGATVRGTLVGKILREHLVEGQPEPETEIALRVDQTLTQDATGTMAYLQFEAVGIDRVRTELSVSYIDHNTLQVGFENADDHLYLAGVARKHGIYLSRAGNGICHQVHLERFARPGRTLIGSDSHTPTAGGVGSLAVGVGGLDVAAAMAGSPLYLTAPKVRRVELLGELPPWVAAKDAILELLRRLTVSGGVGWALEYGGPGVATLTVPQRATITNMGAELGATTSIFPSDERTREWLRAQGREDQWVTLEADPDADYEDRVVV